MYDPYGSEYEFWRFASRPIAPIPKAAPARPNPANGTRAVARVPRLPKFATVPAAVASEGSPAMLCA